MKEYFWNCIISFVTCFLLACLTFLVGRDGGAIASAVFAGIIYGVTMALSYCFGNFFSDDSKFNKIRLIVMLASGIIGGGLGGWLISVG